jgi:hypothetical protein
MTDSIKIRIALCIILLVGGVYCTAHPEALDAPLSWVGASSKIEKAWIVEETANRSALPQTQIIAIRKAETLGIKRIDPGDVPVNEAAKVELAAVLKAVGDKPLPQLARKWSNGRTTSVACPLTFDKLKEAVPCK